MTSPAVTRSMQGNRSRDTRPEMRLRSEMHRLGLRFRKHVRVEGVGYADAVFPRSRVAVFVDGCFWHSCPEHGSRPRSNREFWDAKLARNRARDEHVTRELSRRGWTVVRLWEHEDPAWCAARIREVVSCSSR